MRWPIVALSLSFISCLLFGCGSQPSPTAPETPKDNKQIKLISSAFEEGQAIPRHYTCDGVNISPPLEWSGVPKNAKTITIIGDDPDASSGTWVHWVLFNLPADRIGLIESIPPTEKMPGGGWQGKNDFGNIGYGGPCPPRGTHHYLFKLYAVDIELTMKAGATKADLLKAMEGHVLAQGQLMGTYSR